MTKRKQTSILLEDKYYAIERLKKKECTQEKMASELGVNKSTMSKWTSEEQMVKIKNAYENNIINLRPNIYQK